VIAMSYSTVPDGLPVLSRGRHRTPRRGACLMEVTSLLAGERWSDHPACTHPLLAHLARLVNDRTSDAGRQRLVTLVPSLVDRRGDVHSWLRVPVAVAAATILDVPEGTQRVLAAGLVRAAPLCADAGPALAGVHRQALDTLELVPGAVAWVERLATTGRPSLDSFVDHAAPTMVRCAVEGVVTAGGPDHDRRLRALLEAGIAACPRPERARPPMPVPAAHDCQAPATWRVAASSRFHTLMDVMAISNAESPRSS
jgi:hypothetical protein